MCNFVNFAHLWSYFVNFYISRFRNASSFEGISYAFNDIHFGNAWMLNSDTRVLDRRRLSEAWFKRHLIKWRIELGETDIQRIVNHETEQEIEKHLPSIKSYFSRKWSSTFHTDACKSEGMW